MRWRRTEAKARTKGEAGAVAVMVSILALALMAVAALSVDLGNAWARGRTVQRQADVVAMAAGALMPVHSQADRTAVAVRAAQVFNDNLVSGQPSDATGSKGTVTSAQLLDGTETNGELVFMDGTGAVCADVTAMCTRLRVVPPEAHVTFGLARAFGSTGAEVQRTATVQVFSSLPPKNKLVPLWLPNGCGYGPVDGDTTQGNAAPASPTTTTTSASATATATGTATATATATPTATPIAIDPVGTHRLSGTAAYAPTYGGSINIVNLKIEGVSNSTKKASIRAISPDGTRYIEYASADIKKSTTSFTVADFTIGSELTLTTGQWKLYAVIENVNKLAYSSNFFTVTVPAGPSASTAPTSATTSASATPTASATPSSIPVGCAGQSRGNFGQLDSPRNDGTSGQSALALNFAVGLDHMIIPFDFGGAAPVKSCEPTNHSTIDGAQLDNVSRDGNNCILGDTGNDGPWIYQGLVTGLGGKIGRLNAANGTTTCPAAPGSRSNATLDGISINNEVLSCYLTGTGSLAGIASDTASTDMLDPAIVKSPRFVWLPIVVATDRAQKTYQPILDYVPAFITDETQTTSATSSNGLDINGNSVKVLRLFAFNKAALPPTEQSPETDYDTTIDSPVVHLVG